MSISYGTNCVCVADMVNNYYRLCWPFPDVSWSRAGAELYGRRVSSLPTALLQCFSVTLLGIWTRRYSVCCEAGRCLREGCSGWNTNKAVICFTVGLIAGKSNWRRTETIFHIVLKSQVDHACFMRGEASENLTSLAVPFYVGFCSKSGTLAARLASCQCLCLIVD